MIDRRILDTCLWGISFPADGHEIAECILGNSCPAEAKTQLRMLSPHVFHSEESLLCELGDPVYCS
jgi:hypothetical protein